MRSPARSWRARSTGSKVRYSSTSPTASASCAASSMRAPSPWSGRNSGSQRAAAQLNPSIKLRRVDRRHFHVLVEELVGVGALDVVGLFHLEIFIDQLVILGHALVVVPAERH